MSDTYSSLTEVLVDCFRNDMRTESEHLLHEDVYVTRALKKFLGKKRFEKFDTLDEKVWKQAWADFGIQTKG